MRTSEKHPENPKTPVGIKNPEGFAAALRIPSYACSNILGIQTNSDKPLYPKVHRRAPEPCRPWQPSEARVASDRESPGRPAGRNPYLIFMVFLTPFFKSHFVYSFFTAFGTLIVAVLLIPLNALDPTLCAVSSLVLIVIFFSAAHL